jgi:hypothetical protein
VTRLSTRILVAAVAAAAASGAMLVAAGVPAAAVNAGPVAAVVNADDPTKSSGTSIDPVQITAPAACNPAATRHVTKITAVTPAHTADRAAAKAWVGDNLYATVGVGLPGPLTVQSSNSWQGLADGFGQKLVPGRYDLVLRCQNNVGTKIYEEWHGTVTFSSRTAWKGSTGTTTKAGTTTGATADPGRTTPSAAAGTAAPGGTSAPTRPPASSAAPTGSSPSDSAGVADANNGRGTTGEAVKGFSLVALVLVVGAAATGAIRRARRDASIGQNDQ